MQTLTALEAVRAYLITGAIHVFLLLVTNIVSGTFDWWQFISLPFTVLTMTSAINLLLIGVSAYSTINKDAFIAKFPEDKSYEHVRIFFLGMRVFAYLGFVALFIVCGKEGNIASVLHIFGLLLYVFIGVLSLANSRVVENLLMAAVAVSPDKAK